MPEGRWRSAHLVEARKRCSELAALVENLHKKHRSLYKNEIRYHAINLENETEDAISNARELCKGILRELDAHKKHVRSTERFLRRHYRIIREG